MQTPTRLTMLIIITLLIPIVPFIIIGELPGEKWLSASGGNSVLFGITGSALLAADVLMPIPSSIVGTLLGARLGFFPGWGFAWMGLMTGNLAGYMMGRTLLTRLAPSLPQTPTLLVLFASRPVPVLAEAVTFAAGAGRMPFLPLISICAVGNGIYAALLAGNGAALLPDALLGPGLIIPMALPVCAWLAWRWLARRATEPEKQAS